MLTSRACDVCGSRDALEALFQVGLEAVRLHVRAHEGEQAVGAERAEGGRGERPPVHLAVLAVDGHLWAAWRCGVGVARHDDAVASSLAWRGGSAAEVDAWTE